MTTSAISKTPRFSKNQLVYFIGGVGKILGHKPDSDMWTYTVEMEMEPEPPSMGRVGAETRVLLHEADIQEVM